MGERIRELKRFGYGHLYDFGPIFIKTLFFLLLALPLPLLLSSILPSPSSSFPHLYLSHLLISNYKFRPLPVVEEVIKAGEVWADQDILYEIASLEEQMKDDAVFAPQPLSASLLLY